VKKQEDSKEPWDYYRIVSTIAGKDAFRPESEGSCASIGKKTTN
jgi:branched-chain amino acid transport system substrate-binding protein